MFRSDRRSCGPLDVFLRPAQAAGPRVGIVVPKHGRTIVERNRLKRRLREILRTQWLPDERGRVAAEGGGRDLLVRVRPTAYAAGFEELATALRTCLAPARR
jgi:ribonuclease P protein component